MSDLTELATVAWGYTMADIDRASWVALRRCSAGMIIDPQERQYTAWHGVVEALYSSERTPHFFDLVDGGIAALNRESGAIRHHRGIPTPNKRDRYGEENPQFAKYWRPIKHDHDDGFSDHLVEVMALPDILGVLSDVQYEAIITMAAHDNDTKAAAAALGLKPHAFYNRVDRARKKLKAAWYGDETPPDHRSTGTCRFGHDRAVYGHRGANGQWKCRRCHRNTVRRANAKNTRPSIIVERSLQEAG